MLAVVSDACFVTRVSIPLRASPTTEAYFTFSLLIPLLFFTCSLGRCVSCLFVNKSNHSTSLHDIISAPAVLLCGHLYKEDCSCPNGILKDRNTSSCVCVWVCVVGDSPNEAAGMSVAHVHSSRLDGCLAFLVWLPSTCLHTLTCLCLGCDAEAANAPYHCAVREHACHAFFSFAACSCVTSVCEGI